MPKQYDVVVVGAGLGGLSVATLLAKKGASVLLLERHNVPGGYATSFVRGRYEFEVALHELSGIGPPEHRGPLYRYLDSLGVASQLEFSPIGELYRSVFPDLDVTLPVGEEAGRETLCDTFPHEARGIRRFLDRIQAVGRQVGRLEAEGAMGKPLMELIGNPLTAPSRLGQVVRYLPTTWGGVLDRDVADPRARAVLSQYWGYFGLPPSEVSFFYFAIGLYAYMRLGPWYVKGRSQALSNAFVAALESHGGEIEFNRGVARITSAGGRVDGVVTDDGEQIAARAVVSNADPITTCRILMGEDDVPTEFFASLRGSELSPSSFNVYLGVNRSPEQLGLGRHENFLNADYDFDSVAEDFGVVRPPRITLATCYNGVDPGASPPGTSAVVLTTLYYGQPWWAVPPDEYLDTKRRIADAMIRQTERIAPDLRRYAEVVEVATPVTNMRYTGAVSGSIYGFTNRPWDHTVFRMSHKGPVRGLFFVGQYTQPGGGFEPCMMSGQMAGASVRRWLGKGV